MHSPNNLHNPSKCSHRDLKTWFNTHDSLQTVTFHSQLHHVYHIFYGKMDTELYRTIMGTVCRWDTFNIDDNRICDISCNVYTGNDYFANIVYIDTTLPIFAESENCNPNFICFDAETTNNLKLKVFILYKRKP